MRSLHTAVIFAAAVVISASSALTAEETITRTLLGRTFYYPSDQIHVTVTYGSGGIPVPGDFSLARR